MIVAEDAETFRLIPQPDHAYLSGQVARHWGNDTFATPDPIHSMIIAAEDHDRGWRQYDLAPIIHSDDARPIGFREYSGEEWTTFYGSGIENTLTIDPYAGLMVAIHASGLRRQGYGIRPDIPDMHDDPVYASFVEEQEQFQDEIMAQLQDNERYAPYATDADRAFLNEIHETGDYSGRCRTWDNYLLLEAFDLLSLYFCDNHPLGEITIGPVPVTYDSDEDETELTITPIDDTIVRIDPYPFDISPLTLSTTGRYVPKTFATQEELTEQYYTSERETLVFTVRE